MRASDDPSERPAARSAPMREALQAIVRNPHPRQPFRIVLTFSQAPGPFESMRGQVRYEAPDGAYVPDPIAGVAVVPAHYLPMQFERMAGGDYAATVYADALLDHVRADGECCAWRLASVSVRMKARDASGDTAFLIGLLGRELQQGLAVTSFYDRRNYPAAAIHDFPDIGRSDPARIAMRADWFAATLAVEEPSP